MTYHDFIWDLGGTLIDNYAQSSKAFQKALKDFGIDADIKTVYKYLKRSTDEAINYFIPDNHDFYQHYKSLEKEALRQPLFSIGAEEFLKETAKCGCRHFLISNRDNETFSILERLGIRELFTEVLTSESGFPKKPDPTSMLYLRENYHLKNVLVLGDRPIDKKAGEAAGFDVFLIDENQNLLDLVKGER